jgi:hypothetical protein
VWLGDERVDDVTAHPALSGAASTLPEVFDRQHRDPDDCLISDVETRELVNISHMIPRSVEDLERRNRGLTRISDATVGLAMCPGRSRPRALRPRGRASLSVRVLGAGGAPSAPRALSIGFDQVVGGGRPRRERPDRFLVEGVERLLPQREVAR